MAARYPSFKVEQIEQLALIACLSTHHGKPPPLKASRRRNHCSPIIASTFFNSIGQGRSSLPRPPTVRLSSDSGHIAAPQRTAGWGQDRTLVVALIVVISDHLP